jgi:hypothetical protein
LAAPTEMLAHGLGNTIADNRCGRSLRECEATERVHDERFLFGLFDSEW